MAGVDIPRAGGRVAERQDRLLPERAVPDPAAPIRRGFLDRRRVGRSSPVRRSRPDRLLRPPPPNPKSPPAPRVTSPHCAGWARVRQSFWMRLAVAPPAKALVGSASATRQRARPSMSASEWKDSSHDENPGVQPPLCGAWGATASGRRQMTDGAGGQPAGILLRVRALARSSPRTHVFAAGALVSLCRRRVDDVTSIDTTRLIRARALTPTAGTGSRSGPRWV